MADRCSTRSLGLLAALAALGLAPAAAQDYSAGKTAAQLFQSDCTACHKSPAGLAKGRNARSLAAFLREHYTTKEESAVALAAFLAGAGGGAGAAEAKQKGQAPASGSSAAPKPKPAARNAEGEPEPRARPDDEPESTRERAARAPAAGQEGVRIETEGAVRKLRSYGAAGGDAKDTERLSDPIKTLEYYASAGSTADAIAPADGAATKPKPPEKKKKKSAAAPAAPASASPAPPASSAASPSPSATRAPSPPAPAAPPAPRRPPDSVIQRQSGNN